CARDFLGIGDFENW
nr:immunoglobulin heavy chain junction region [Macaca mulatta]MOW86362.1 immunoglobulin heavy chain junction region [Macaca mulatta]